MEQIQMIPCINPATGVQFDEVAMSTAEDIRRAHVEMRQNFEVWRQKPARERARILKVLQEVLVEQADEISRVVNQDTGKSRQDALAELFLVLDKLSTYRRLAPKWLARQRVPRGIYFFKKYYTVRRPYGVAAIIGPWNYPLDLTIPPVFAALLAGNTVILKPSEVTPAVGALLERIFQSLPEIAPFVRVLHGDGTVGAALVAGNPDVVFLTGSVETGRKVAQATAETMTPFISELGGKDPMIVLQDANIEAAARWGVWGAFTHAGQACVAVERTYVVQEVYEQFVAAVLAETKRVRLGYSAEAQNTNDVGPLTFERQAKIISDHLQDALSKGAQILTGGECEGLFMEPTVVVGVDHTMKLMCEETFGPVLPVMKVQDEDEAVRLANDSQYGLSASVWSEDLARAERVAQKLEVGSVVVNDALAHYAVPQLPFGGMKQSGTARTHGRQDVLQFTQIQSHAVGPVPNKLDIAASLREPDKYSLMSALLHVLFGVSLRQRVRAVPHIVAHVANQRKPAQNGERVERSASGAVFTGVFAALAVLVALMWRGREKGQG